MTYLELKKFITQDMSMAHIYQPVMLIELLKNKGCLTKYWDKNNIMKIFIGALLLLLHLACFAQTWVPFSVGQDGDIFSYDPSSLSRQGKTFKITILGNYKDSLKIQGGLAFSHKSVRIVDCVKPREKMVSLAAYPKLDAQGEALASTHPVKPEWEELKVVSVINDLRAKFCAS